MRLKYVFIMLMLVIGSVQADELADRMALWESKAFTCKEGGKNFPSKHRLPDAQNLSECEDGDMTLFNGLLCSAGDMRGCEGVKKSQSVDGRWWRSPLKIGVESNPTNIYPASFSADMALGVLHYAVKTGDTASFTSWAKWLEISAPCLVVNPLDKKCIITGWPRLCTDDWEAKICTFRPITCDELEIVGKAINSTGGDICRKILTKLGIKADYILPTTELAAGAAVFNDRGYPLHLAAAKIYLLDKMGLTSVASRTGAIALAIRDDQNPFFLFLAEGPSAKVKQMVLRLCPSNNSPPSNRDQWSWERDSSKQEWVNSMYWDCIFMGKLLGY